MAANRAVGLQVVDPVLTNVARLYKPRGFIADRLLAKIPVSLLAGLYPIFDEAYWFGNEVDNLVKDRAPAREVDFEWSTEAYSCDEFALKVSITDLERQQANPALRLESHKVNYLSNRMAIAREVRVAALLTTITNGGGIANARASTPSVNWDQDTATIEADIKAGVLDVYDAIGTPPNTIVIPYKVAYAMAIQEDIRNILAAQITGQGANFLELGGRVLPARIHGMDVVVPEGAQRNTAREGAAKAISEIWGDEVRLLYVDQNAGWGMPTTAYRFVHTQPRVTRWRENDPEVEYIKELERNDEKVVAPNAAHILQNVLS